MLWTNVLLGWFWYRRECMKGVSCWVTGVSIFIIQFNDFDFTLTCIDIHKCSSDQTVIKSINVIFQMALPFVARQYKKDVRVAIEFIRKTGHDLLKDRQKAILNGEDVPEDILTFIIQANGEVLLRWLSILSMSWKMWIQVRLSLIIELHLGDKA